MKQELEAIRAKALEAIGGAEKAEDLETLRVQYLGKKGELTAVLKQMGKLSPSVETRTKELAAKALEMKLKAEAVDVTIPGKAVKIGKKHPMYQVLDEIKDIFVGMGFEILEDREVETADYNFTKLNCLEGHPAREWTDTFYFTEDSSILLRTQTSPMQIHAMETRSLPIRILAPGRVYRKDEVLRELNERDYNDSRRAAAPLRAAEDAIVVDTSALDFDASREALLALIRERLQ